MIVDGLGYGQIYLNPSLEVCLTNNKLRHGDERINEDVIVGMNSRLEPPDLMGNTWEQHSIELNSDLSVDLTRYVSCSYY